MRQIADPGQFGPDRDRGFNRGGPKHEHKGGAALCSIMND
jgi:hypothetical protein